MGPLSYGFWEGVVMCWDECATLPLSPSSHLSHLSPPISSLSRRVACARSGSLALWLSGPLALFGPVALSYSPLGSWPTYSTQALICVGVWEWIWSVCL
mmetsp:Transcript_113394/g.156710  ORF Transcript_113394/g.156710 Transcript_113394/m.156710 type:complete len:99 (+) Transcript_113394:556-852(+)